MRAVNLFLRRVAPLLASCAALLLAACATPSGTQDGTTSGASVAASAPSAAGTPPAETPPAARGDVRSPVLGFRDRPSPDQGPAVPGFSRPLDATRLPPFEGRIEEIREPAAIAQVDRTVRHDDLWQRMRAGFAMADLTGPLVDEKTAWYVQRPDYLKRVFDRSRRYLYHILEEIEKRGLPTELALLPMVESSFNPMAYSRAHASGLWQFIPGTGKRYELTQNWWYDGRRDIVASTSAALEYLNDIYEMHGDWHLALASYNWGENAVARALEKNRAARLPLDYSSINMPLETRHYVPKLQALKNIVANPALFNVELDPIPNQAYFATITKTRDLDIRLAAKLAEMPVEEFIALNPGFSRPLIRAEMTPRIVLPADRVALFHENLTKYDDKSLVTWRTYQPQKGETLESIAKKFGMAVAQLREVNGITPRNRGMPTMLVVPAPGGVPVANQGRMPIMYAPPIPMGGSPRTLSHTVKAGETLASIAGRYKVSMEDLRRWNKIGRLAPGQKLTIQTRAPAGAKGESSARAAKGKPRQATPPKKKK
jgi:membrane-bound lytic murein transglycosylase D